MSPTAPSKVLFILGGGPRIGHAVAKRFLQDGYRIAVGRRNPGDGNDTAEAEAQGVFLVSVDVASRQSVKAAFHAVKSQLGVPNVVVYNAADLTFPSHMDDPFAISPAEFEHNLAVNATGAYSALHHASRGFLHLKKAFGDSDDVHCVFIATGDVSPFHPDAAATTLGPGKAALAYLIQVGMKAYEQAGIRFYFASQVTAEGKVVPESEVSAVAHGEVYVNLVNRDLVRDVWHVKFSANKEGTKVKVEWESE
ncbi:hypothetical protein A1O1_03545 [Capronia coronata CBS 617.96]|uniref:NAD(P)-binding protein n=1 Tax=Capronia coronata CBS 617.96 TaxID=1182541 RepID=W9YD65_9EURO|nr:uncharacterized protein A1O1_03545 [Capronia coronata CBS 617.96]EXJ90443.1 hypothetical protein A1O1_03545 [Capronia coronata CBS 617.96]